MVRIAGVAVAADLGENPGTSAGGIIHSLQNQVGCALTERNALAISIERPACIRIHRLKHIEAAVGQPAKRIRAAREGVICVTRPKKIDCHADRAPA